MENRQKQRLNYILLALAGVALVVLIFNVKFIGIRQGDQIRWMMPVRAVENDEGVMCVLDDNRTKITILNPDKRIRARIETNFRSTILPDMVSEVAMDDRYIYFTDMMLSENGTSIKGERVLKYTLDGKYVATLHTDTGAERSNISTINCLKVFRDTLYIVKSAGNLVTVTALCDSTERLKKSHRFWGNVVMYATYQPEIDAICASTMNGQSYVVRKGVAERVSTADTTAYITSVLVMGDGGRYILDANNGVLIYREADGSERKICRTDAISICGESSDEHIFLCDQTESTVTSISLKDQSQSVLRSAEWPTRHIALWITTLACGALVALVLIYFIMSFVVFVVKKKMGGGEEDGVLSPASLYGKPALFIIAAFVVTGVLVSIAYYHNTLESARMNTKNLANAISAISGQTIGDKVKRLDSADEFGNEDYMEVYEFCTALCEERRGEGFDLLFDIYRIDKATGNLAFVVDHSRMYLLGTPVSRKRMERMGSDTLVDAVIEGSQKLLLIDTDQGPGLIAALAPIYDHHGDVVGVIVVINNMNAISSYLREDILSILLRAFTLLTVLLMLYAEAKLLMEFVKVRKERIAAAGHRITICEGHRTIRILSRVPFYMLVPFIAPYSKELATESGLGYDAGMMAAIPLSLYGLVMAVGMVFVGFAVNKSPRRSMYVANIIYIAVAIALLANHLYFRNYYLLVVAFVLIGIAAATSTTAIKGMRLRDMKPDKRYSKLVFNNMEAPIYGSVGTAAGALLYDLMGFVAVGVAFTLVCVVCMLLSYLFMGDDLNQDRRDKAVKRSMTKAQFRYFMRLDVITYLMIVWIPASFLPQFSSFMLPVFNESLGYSVLVVAILTLIIKMLPIMVSPSLTAVLKDKSYVLTTCLDFGVNAVLMFVFALNPTMISFALLLIASGILGPVSCTVSDKFQIDSAKSAGILPEDVNGVFAMCSSVGDFAGPVCIAAMMAMGTSAVGWISGGAYIAFILVLLLTKLRSLAISH